MKEDIMPSWRDELLAEGQICIDSIEDVKAFIAKLNELATIGADLFIKASLIGVDSSNEPFVNKYAINLLFPDENSLTMIKRELREASLENYICSLINPHFRKRGKEIVFGKVMKGKNVYIKIRVDLRSEGANIREDDYYISLSFLISNRVFTDADFPYRLK